jgi:hypothetical protein
MTRPASVTADDLVAALKRRRAKLPAEIGSFVVLEACEALLVRGPELLALDGIHITEEGSVWLPPGTRCAEADAAVALHRVLAMILVAAGPAPPPALMRLLERGPAEGSWTLSALRDDLEASLVPLNRGASRRVLARFVREIGWAERAPAQNPGFGQLDSELSSFLGVAEPVRATPAGPPLRERLRDAEITQQDPVPEEEEKDDVRFFESVRPALKPPETRTVVDPPPASDLVPARDAPARHASLRPSSPAGAPRPSRSTWPAPDMPRKTSALVVGAALLVLSVLVLFITFKLRPELKDRLVRGPSPAPTAPAPPKVIVKRPAGGDLVVRVATERAQILRLVGRGPVSVPYLPLGVAHEFVAIADGLVPARLLIPANAEWEATPDGRRYEAAMQLGTPGPGQSALELGETLLPQDVGSPSTTLGTVRIVTTPRGAKVYQVIGFAPEALMEQLPVEATQELLVFRKGYAPELRVIGPGDYVEVPGGGGRRRADIAVTLSPLASK